LLSSKRRVRVLLEGRIPDRPPLFDLLHNDAVIEYFSSERITEENKERVVPLAISTALDATRPRIRLPQQEREEILPDGRRRRFERWTEWEGPRRYNSSSEYCEERKKSLATSWDWNEKDEKELEEQIHYNLECERRLGDVYLFWGRVVDTIGFGFVDTGLNFLYNEIGLEQFAYLMADCPQIISAQLEYYTTKSIQKIHHIPPEVKVESIFIAEDIASKDSTLFSPLFLRREFFPRLAKIIKECHSRGIKVLFHSDGNLMSVLDDLIEAGIDILNPIDVAAGMKIREIHRRYPNLLMAGGIDANHLLPFARPEEIKDAVKRAIDDAEGKIMIGSSTEVHNAIPLENYLALWNTVKEFRFN